MTNKEAMKILKTERNINAEIFDTDFYEALNLAIKALEILDDVNHKVYRNENCDRKRRCYDYIGYHCAGCNGAKEAENE